MDLWTAKRSGHKQEILMFTPNWRMASLFSFIIMLFYIIWVRILEEVYWSVDAIALEKTREMSFWRAGKCLHFHNSKESKKGTLFQSFLYAFHQGLALVHSGEVSVIERCPRARVNCRLIQSWLCLILYFS